MYTIQFLTGGAEKQAKVFRYLSRRLPKDGRFKAELSYAYDKGLPSIRIKKVRLTKAKPYCGQHPGECQVIPGRKKPRATYLEWDDWIKFHAIVNKALNRFRADANVWSNPPDVRGKMWIRKGKRPRIRWDWHNDYGRYGRLIQVWNQGTDDQFGPEVGARRSK